MSQKELQRLKVVENAVQGRLRVAEAAELLPRSDRHLDAFCRGRAEGLAEILAQGNPIILVGDGDLGGLIGLHSHAELELLSPGLN